MFNFTGLSFGIEALAELEGTLLFEELMQSKEVISLNFLHMVSSLKPQNISYAYNSLRTSPFT